MEEQQQKKNAGLKLLRHGYSRFQRLREACGNCGKQRYNPCTCEKRRKK